MNFVDNLLAVLAVAFIGWLYYAKQNPAVQANNTVPFWYTAAGTNTVKSFDYASQSNYLQEATNVYGN